ncbi:MAG TPA: hypothetical protein VGL09_01055 [Methylomirabilota bacterium]
MITAVFPFSLFIIYSARVSLGYRAVGLMEGDEITWFWIGTHGEYDRLLDQL